MIFLSLFFPVAIQTALAADPLCAPDVEAKLEKSIPIPDDVNYFVRSDNRQEISFATSDGNRILNLATGKIMKVPGDVDPVVSPDGDLLSVPTASLYDGKEHKFKNIDDLPASAATSFQYSVLNGQVWKKVPNHGSSNPNDYEFVSSKKTVADLKKEGANYETSRMMLYMRDDNGKPGKAFGDEDIYGNYQSLGVLRTSKDEIQYRLLYAMTGLIIRDYNYNPSTQTIEPAGPPRPACGNSKSDDGSLPMISKDGREFTAFDYKSGVTNIYRIDSSSQKCEIMDSIPAMVGKADFSPNGKRLAFHVDEGSGSENFRNRIEPWFRHPHKQDKLAVFVYDRATKTLLPIEDKKNVDSYYPVFLDNDHIAFVSATKGKPQKFSVDVVSLRGRPGVRCTGCTGNNEARQHAAFVGFLYSRKCGLGDLSFRSALAGFSRLTKRRCHQLISSLTANRLDQMKRFAIKSAEPARDPNYPNNTAETTTLARWDKDILHAMTIDDLNKVCDSFEEPPEATDSHSVR